MGVESTELEPQNWLAVDAGATRIRVAPILFSGRPRLAGPIASANFETTEAPSRVEQAAALIGSVAEQAGWAGPFRLGLAWAGAPTPDGRGTRSARYGPAIPDLVERLAILLPLNHLPSLHSDARAALEGAAVEQTFASAYALISGSGLGEAYYSEGRSWTREEFQSRLGRAGDWQFQGQDGENWLRAEAWRHTEPPLAALSALIEHRLARVQPQVLVFGGHFREWFERGWLDLGQSWWGRPLLQLGPEAPLLGSVQMEQRRLTNAEARS